MNERDTAFNESHTMTTPHKDADKLRAIAGGKQMQVYGNNGNPWVDASPGRALVAICAGEPCRIKPEFVLINGVECPKPVPPPEGKYTARIMILNQGTFWELDFAELADAETVCRALVKPFKECKE